MGPSRCPIQPNDPRMVPILRVGEAAFFLGVPRSTLQRWMSSRHGLVTRRPGARRTLPSVPFVGLAEASVVLAFLKAGVPLARIWPALVRLQKEIGIEHVLASKRLYTDGAEVLWHLSTGHGPQSPVGDLVVCRNDQLVLSPTVEQYLRLITYDEAGWATRLRLSRFGDVPVIVDPLRAFGRPLIDHGVGVRVEDVLDMSAAGEPPQGIAEAYDLPVSYVEGILAVAEAKAA